MSPASSKAATVVRPTATPKMNTLVGLAGRTSATLGSAANRLAIGREVRTTFPDPASSARERSPAAGCAVAIPPERSSPIKTATTKRGITRPLEFVVYRITTATEHPHRRTGRLARTVYSQRRGHIAGEDR